MPATVVYREEDEKPNGSRYEMVAWQVPVSEDFPQGLKYSFQYMNATATRSCGTITRPTTWMSVGIIDTRLRATSRSWSSQASPT